MLYRETAPGVYTQWIGQALPDPITGDPIIHAPEIEARWTYSDLAEWGLYIPFRPPVPEGKREVGDFTVEEVNGVVMMVYQYADVVPDGPGNHMLNDRQLRMGLAIHGIAPEMIDAKIAEISNPSDRLMAQIWWDRSPWIDWNHPMTKQFIAIMGMPPELAAAMWMVAASLDI